MSKAARQEHANGGLVLVSTLILLTVLLAVGGSVRFMLQSDYRIVSNLRGNREAFYFAEAGLAWVKNAIAEFVGLTNLPLVQPQTFAAGSFAITVNKTSVVDSLSARFDVQSSGQVGVATQLIRARITKRYYLGDAGLGLRGTLGPVAIGTQPIEISGYDHDPATQNSSDISPTAPAISVGDASSQAMVEAASAAGLGAATLSLPGAPAPISASQFLAGGLLAQLAQGLCSTPQAIVTQIAPASTLAVANEIWGGAALPQLRCFQGAATDAGDFLDLSAVSGSGILVVKDAGLILSGSLQWEGLIVISGDNVGLSVSGTESKQILGSVLVNETSLAPSSTPSLNLQGSVKMLYSRKALQKVAPMLTGVDLSTSYPTLPVKITQDYWRSMTP